MNYLMNPKLGYSKLYRTSLDGVLNFAGKRFFGGKKSNLIFFDNALSNVNSKYSVITVPIVEDTYDFKVLSIDNLDNINTGTGDSKALAAFLWYPLNFAITLIDGSDVTVSWSIPTGGKTPTGFKIFGNGGSGNVIDRVTPLATVSAVTTSETLTLANGIWLLVVEAYDATDQTINWFTQKVTIPTSAVVPPPPFSRYEITNVSLRNESVGKCRINFIWLYGSQADSFNIYHDNGTGTIDWGTVAFNFARQESKFQTYVTDQICFVDTDTTYKFGIRAVNSEGLLDAETNEYSVILDGVAPDEIDSIDIEEF